MKLPEHELKMTLDPAAVSFSAAHHGQVLVVEQAVAREGCLSQSPKYKGLIQSVVRKCCSWQSCGPLLLSMLDCACRPTAVV